MIEPPLPVNERERLESLRRLEILDTRVEERFDRITRLLAEFFRAPMALVSLVSEDRQWFKSCVGLSVRETPRRVSFCAHAITSPELFIIPDTHKDERFCDNPLVVGEPFIRFYAGRPLSTPDGAIVGTLCVLDRHPRSMSETDRQILLDLGAIAERELGNIELNRLTFELEGARDEALRQAHSKAEFLSMMSHEIRTPLHACLASADLLSATELDSEQREYNTTILDCGNALLGVINDILDFSKIESGNFQIDLNPCNVRELVAGALRILQPQASGKHLELRASVADEVPERVVTDDERVRQILFNLLSNAVKFTSSGSVSVSVSVRSPAGSNGMIRLLFEVEDSGIGIPEDRISELFEPFKQGDPTIAKRFGGTGLGLSICKRLAVLLGGRIWADSTPGKGSKFSFIIRGRVADDSMQDISGAAAPAPVTVGSGLRVLLVEDNATSLKLGLRMLAKLDCKAEASSDGLDAVERVRTGRFDVVFMDMELPGIDGLEAARRIRAGVPPERQPKIVALTANVLPEHRQRCLEAGMDDFLTKPFKLAGLQAVLADAVPGSGGDG